MDFFTGVSQVDENCDCFNRGHRQAIKRTHRYHTAGLVDDIKVVCQTNVIDIAYFNILNSYDIFTIYIY